MSYEHNTRPIKPVIDGDKLHYQTDPFLEDGKVKIIRISTTPIEIVTPMEYNAANIPTASIGGDVTKTSTPDRSKYDRRD